ncbi:hypothetical protein QYF61_018402 [Mycteria americana]|uniref:Uncharacterized protein n=1 Tax=Mycteria americana TaxID=33587 RepID=A0AAN7RRG8_MYCAM|nr:hypothetical protein QYF61_018402 [Mycteria americana]
MMERGLVSTSASSFSTLGWISSGPIDFSSQSSLVSQAGLLPRRLVFRHLGTACSCAFRTSSLKNVQPSWTPLPIRAASQGTLSTSLLNRPKSALRKSKKLYHFVITLPKTASNHHIAHKSFSVHEQEVQRDAAVARNAQEKILLWLLQFMQEQGISLDEADQDGNTAVHIAAQRGYLGCIQGETKKVERHETSFSIKIMD